MDRSEFEVVQGSDASDSKPSEEDWFSYHLDEENLNQVFRRTDAPSSVIQKTLDEILQEFKQNGVTGNISDWSEVIKDCYNQVLSYKTKWETKPKDQIQNWCNKNRGLKKIVEIIAVLDRAHEILNDGKGLTICQLLSLLILTEKTGGNYGRFCEMLPGEGQATVCAMFSILKILAGDPAVDIICGTEELAKAAVGAFVDLYDIFGVTAAANDLNLNCNEVPERKTKIYAAEVIYGTVRSFQLDYLHDISTSSGLRHKRGFGNVIIDDSSGILFEDYNIVTNLSICLEPSDIFTSIWTNIWRNLQVAEELWATDASDQINSKYKELQILETEKELSKKDCMTQYSSCCDEVVMCTSGVLITTVTSLVEPDSYQQDLPDHTAECVKAFLEEWIENAIYAKYVMQKNKHYRVETLNNCSKVIPIYDSITTSRLDFSRKVHELLPFLQLKENLQMQPPAMTSCRISTYGYLNLYGSNITVLTETQRSKMELDFIETVYKLEAVTIPRLANFGFQELQVRIIPDRHWLKTIAIDANLKVVQDRGAVLIICRTDKECQDVENCVQLTSEIAFKGSTSSITIKKILKQNELNDEELSPGTIVITIDDVARHLRLKMSKELISNGNVHVCIGFCPTSERHKQLLLHNALKGIRGTAQLMVRFFEIKSMPVMNECNNDANGNADEENNDANRQEESDIINTNNDQSTTGENGHVKPSSEVISKPNIDEPFVILATLISTDEDGATISEQPNYPIQPEGLTEKSKLFYRQAAPGDIKAYYNTVTGFFSIVAKETASNSADGITAEYRTIPSSQEHKESLNSNCKTEDGISEEVRKIGKFWESVWDEASTTDFIKYYNPLIKFNEKTRLEYVTTLFKKMLCEDQLFYLFWKYYFEQIKNEEKNGSPMPLLSKNIERSWATWVRSNRQTNDDGDSNSEGVDEDDDCLINESGTGCYSDCPTNDSTSDNVGDNEIDSRSKNKDPDGIDKACSSLFEIFLNSSRDNVETIHDCSGTSHEITEIPIETASTTNASNDIENHVWGKYGIIGLELMKKLYLPILQPVLEDLKEIFLKMVRKDINEHVKSFLDVELVGGEDKLGDALKEKFTECFEQVWLYCRPIIVKVVQVKTNTAPEKYLENHRVIPWKKLTLYTGVIEDMLKTQFKVIRNAPEDVRKLPEQYLLERVSNSVVDTMTDMFLHRKRRELTDYPKPNSLQRQAQPGDECKETPKLEVISNKKPQSSQTFEDCPSNLEQLAEELKLRLHISEEISREKLELAYMMEVIQLDKDFEHLKGMEAKTEILRMEDIAAISGYIDCPILLESETAGIIVKAASPDITGELIKAKYSSRPDELLDSIAKETDKSSLELRQHVIKTLQTNLKARITWHRNIQSSYADLLGGMPHCDPETAPNDDPKRDGSLPVWEYVTHEIVAQAVILESENRPGNKQEFDGVALENIDKGHSLRKHSSHSAGEEFLKKTPNAKKLTTFSDEGSQAKALVSCLQIIPDKQSKFPYSVHKDYEVHVKVPLGQEFKMCEFTRDDRKKPKCKESVANYITMVIGYRQWKTKKLLHVQTIFPRLELPEGISADPYFITTRSIEKFVTHYPGKAKYKVLVKRYFP